MNRILLASCLLASGCAAGPRVVADAAAPRPDAGYLLVHARWNNNGATDARVQIKLDRLLPDDTVEAVGFNVESSTPQVVSLRPGRYFLLEVAGAHNGTSMRGWRVMFDVLPGRMNYAGDWGVRLADAGYQHVYSVTGREHEVNLVDVSPGFAIDPDAEKDYRERFPQLSASLPFANAVVFQENAK